MIIPLPEGSASHSVRTAKFGIARGLAQYNDFVRELPSLPVLSSGLDGFMRNRVAENTAVGRTTNYLDACGGMGCAATEFAVLFGPQGGRAFVVDTNEWTIHDLAPEDAEIARREGRRWGVEDNLSRQFAFFRSDAATVKIPEKMDIITVFAGLHFVDDPLMAVINLYNHLKTGGIFMAHYPCRLAHEEALDWFHKALAGLSRLGATVECDVSRDKRQPDDLCLQMVVIRNDSRDVRLNLAVKKRIPQETVAEKRNLSTKIVYYRITGGAEAVEFTPGASTE